MHKKLSIFLCSILMAASLFNPLTVLADEVSAVESSEANTEADDDSESQFDTELIQSETSAELTSEYIAEETASAALDSVQEESQVSEETESLTESVPVSVLSTDDGSVIFYGTQLGYDSDVVMPEGYTSFVLYSANMFYSGTFDKLYLDDNGNYYIPANCTIGRLNFDGAWNTSPWTQYSNRNIGSTVYYYNVPVYDFEDNSLLISSANYNQSAYVGGSGFAPEPDSSGSDESDAATSGSGSSGSVDIIIQDTEMQSLIYDEISNNDAQLNGYEQQVLDRLDVISVCLIVLVALMISFLVYRR